MKLEDLRRAYAFTEVNGFAQMLTATAGRTVEASTVEMWGGAEWAVVLFTDGTGFAVEYSEGEPGYSEYTPGSPGYSTCYTLRKNKSP